SQRQNELLELQQRSEALQQAWQTAREACVQAAQQLAQQRDALARDNQRLEEELAAFAGLLTDAQLLHWRESPAQTFMALDGEITTRLQQLQAQAEQVEEQRQRQEKLQALALEQQHLQESDALARDNQRLEEELAAFAGLLTDAQLLHWRESPAQTFMALDGEITTRLQQLQAQAEQVEEQRQRQEKLQALALEQQHLQ